VQTNPRVEHPASIPDFYTEVREYLVEHEAEHGLMLAVAYATLVAPAEAYWSLVRMSDGRVAAAALRTMPKMILSREGAPGAMAAIAHDARGANFQSIIGPPPSLAAFSRAYGGSWHSTFHHVVYECRSVQPPPPTRGIRRVAGPSDRDRLVEWIRAFSDEAIGDGATLQAAESLADRHVRDGSMWLWCVDDEPVACTAAVGRTPHGIRISSVYTPRHHRRHGYASALVASVTSELLAGGRAFVFLYADRANPTANGIYQRIGYRLIADAGELMLEK
jgi:predicted GNAT family acetyltransferase